MPCVVKVDSDRFKGAIGCNVAQFHMVVKVVLLKSSVFYSCTSACFHMVVKDSGQYISLSYGCSTVHFCTVANGI